MSDMNYQTFTINTKIKGRKKDNLNLTTNDILSKITQTKEGYEIITRKNPVVPHYDYDFYYKTELAGKSAYTEDIVRIKNELSLIYDLNQAKVIILPSCGIDKDKQKKNKPCYKNSINIILRGIGYYANNDIMPKPQGENALYDKNIYGAYQKIRLPFTSKQGQNRFKNLQGADGTLYNLQNFHKSGFKYEDLLISNVEGEILQSVIKPNEDIINFDEIPDDTDEIPDDTDEIHNNKFKTPEHLKLLLKCLLIERIDNLADWLKLMRICKNILLNFAISDQGNGRAEIHIHMKQTPDKYKYEEVEVFLNTKDDNPDENTAGFGSLAKMAKEDNEQLYLSILGDVCSVKTDIFDVETIKKLRKKPRIYFWSDFIQFDNKKMKNANAVLKYLTDSNFIIINGGIPYYTIYDKSIKKMNKRDITTQYKLERKKNHPFGQMRNMCKFWINDIKYTMYEFSTQYFIKNYYMYSEMLPYAGKNDPLIYNENLYNQKVLNKFEGFGYAKYQYENKQKATLTKFLNHILIIICDNNQALNTYVLCYLADIIQNPERKPEVCLLLQGEEGSGKNILVELVKLILGAKYCFDTYNINDILGGFNIHLSGKLLVIGDELVGYAGFKKSDFVKGMITSPNINITRKGVDTEQEASYHRYIFTTNNFETLRISNKDRRVCVIAVSSKMIGNYSYFKNLKSDMNQTDNIKMLFDYLMAIDLDDWNFRQAPITKLKREMVINQLDNVYNWFSEYAETLRIEGPELKIKVSDAIENFKESDRINGNIRSVDFKRRMIVNLKCSYKRFTNGRYFVFNVVDTNKLLIDMLNLDYSPLIISQDDQAPYDSEDEN
jgi:hypothetical protein